jgi:hypothetical protein
LHQLTTPRAAGLAGVLFAVLFATSITLIHTSLPAGGAPGSQWLDGATGRLKIAAILMPFAGICFLWFIGVVRDGLGRFEDKFFASVFLGSGLLFLAMVFASSAVGVALVTSRTAELDPTVLDEVGAFGQALLITLSKTYALRMAGVFMISLATIWLKTGLVSRWLVGVTYVSAVILLVASDISMWMTLAFPSWVLIVSLLALNRSGVIDFRRDE